MSAEEKKAYLLVKAVIFHYHGLDENEKQYLEETAQRLDAHEELVWCNIFIGEDPISAFDRARDFLRETMNRLGKDRRIEFLTDVWNANLKKGYISEMEAMAVLTLAKDWDVEHDLVSAIKKGSAKSV